MIIALVLIALLATIGSFVFLSETVVPYISLAALLGLSGFYVITSVSLFNILLTLFLIMCIFMLLLIMVQQSKGSMGLGSFGGSAQMLFGGAGGQDLFQKTTWICGALFMLGSLGLTLAKSHEMKKFSYTSSAFKNNKIKQSTTPVSTEEPTEEPTV